MAGKCKSNTSRTRITQKLDRRACQPTVERKVSLPDGSTLAIAHVNGTYMLARFKGDRPLDNRPMRFEGQNGQHRAYMELSAQAGYTVLPTRTRNSGQ